MLLINGKYYGFEWDGCLFDEPNQTFWCDSSIYRVKTSGGVLYTDEWYIEDRWGQYYYYGTDAKAARGFQTVNGKGHCFWDNGQMVKNTIFYVDNAIYAVDEDGNAAALSGTGWQKANGKWYYMKKDGQPAQYEVVRSNGKTYYFSNNGQMITGSTVIENGKNYVIDSDGTVTEVTGTGWKSVNGEWYYIKNDGLFAIDEVLNVKGSYYAFNGYGVLYNTPDE